MTLNVMLDKGAKMPTRAYQNDAGMDLYCKEGYGRYTVEIPPRGSVTFDTGVHIQIPKGYVGMVKSKSGMNIKSGITCEGVVDADYNGSIRVRLLNTSLDKAYIVCPGDKIAQLVIIPVVTPQLVKVKEFPETERGSDGFGSTGVR